MLCMKIPCTCSIQIDLRKKGGIKSWLYFHEPEMNIKYHIVCTALNKREIFQFSVSNSTVGILYKLYLFPL